MQRYFLDQNYGQSLIFHYILVHDTKLSNYTSLKKSQVKGQDQKNRRRIQKKNNFHYHITHITHIKREHKDQRGVNYPRMTHRNQNLLCSAGIFARCVDNITLLNPLSVPPSVRSFVRSTVRLAESPLDLKGPSDAPKGCSPPLELERSKLSSK